MRFGLEVDNGKRIGGGDSYTLGVSVPFEETFSNRRKVGSSYVAISMNKKSIALLQNPVVLVFTLVVMFCAAEVCTRRRFQTISSL